MEEVQLKLNKPKKERSPAQKEATAKALTILRSKRDAQKKQQEEEVAGIEEDKKEAYITAKKEQQKAKKLVNTLKAVPPEQAPYITATDFAKFKSEILSSMKPIVYGDAGASPYREPKVVEKVVEKPIVYGDAGASPYRERIIEKPVVYGDAGASPYREKTIVKEVPINRIVSGNELLDRIFFNR